MAPDPIYLPLLALLERRSAVIADHAWRDRDAATHLAALQEVSEALMAEPQRLGQNLPARLRHYLTQCSYSKAAAWIESGGVE